MNKFKVGARSKTSRIVTMTIAVGHCSGAYMLKIIEIWWCANNAIFDINIVMQIIAHPCVFCVNFLVSTGTITLQRISTMHYSFAHFMPTLFVFVCYSYPWFKFIIINCLMAKRALPYKDNFFKFGFTNIIDWPSL